MRCWRGTRAQADIVVGTPIAGRGRTELEGLIGFFVNTLVLRTDVGGDPRFDELLARVKQVALDAYAHQDVPFERIVDELRPDANTGRTPIFQVMFNLHNEPSAAPALEGLDVSALGVARDTAKFDLTVSLSETAAGLFATLEYNSDLFDAQTMAALGDYYARVLEAVRPSRGCGCQQYRRRRARRALPAASCAGTDLVSAFAARVAAAPRGWR